jgi:hypothetical protein
MIERDVEKVGYSAKKLVINKGAVTLLRLKVGDNFWSDLHFLR